MPSRIVLLLLCLVPFAMAGCGDSGSGAPLDREAHQASWIATHPPAALAVANFADCVVCHGSDLDGNGAAVSCYSCHSFNTTPPFIIHPADWTDAYFNHRGYAATNGTTSCANCHGSDLHGSLAAPSCFTTDIDGRSCHADGPGQVPHPLDGTYLSGSVHGPDAAADLTVCQSCHGEPGGPGSNPRFNVGIISVSGTGCEGCHGVNYAHPSTWGADPGATFHNDAGNLANACTLCHGVALDGVGGVGVSCLDCHGASPADNPSGCLSCHGQPPNAAAPVGAVSPNRTGQHNRAGHTSPSINPTGPTCARCHFGAGSGTSNHFDGSNPADVVFDHPDASDTISAVSDGSNTTCTGACHITSGTVELIWPHTGATWY